MTWFKVCDTLHSHPKVRVAGEAMTLWLLAGSHCAAYLTDGFVSDSVGARLAGGSRRFRAWADRLVAVELWAKREGGYVFHDWDKYQPSKAEVLAETERKREAGRKGGQARAKAEAKARAQADALAPASAAAGPPSRPVPSRPDLKRETRGGAPSELPMESQGERASQTRVAMAESREASGPVRPTRSPSALLANPQAARDAWEGFREGVASLAWGKGLGWQQEGRVGGAIVARIVADGGDAQGLWSKAEALGQRWAKFCGGQPKDPIKVPGWLGEGAPVSAPAAPWAKPSTAQAPRADGRSNWTQGGLAKTSEEGGDHGDLSDIRGAGGN